MSDNFVHLHVASGFSMRYGASSPEALVQRAADLGQPALALTDRDGLYGAVRFARACDRAGIAAVIGVDLAIDPADPTGRGGLNGARVTVGGQYGPLPRPRAPARGGQQVDPRLPRVTVLARGRLGAVPPGVGWARLCRLVTATHLRGERGRPVTSVELIAAHASVPDLSVPRPMTAALTVLVGPDSDVGRALLGRQTARARALLARWMRVLPPGGLAVEVVCHGGPEGTSASAGHAGRLWQLALEAGVPCVLTAAVRHALPGQAAVADILDAARRLVPLDIRHLDRTTTAGYLAPAAQMTAVATRLTGDSIQARRLLADTVVLAMECAQDSRTDLGVGSVHLPEPAALGLAAGVDPQRVLAQRCRGAVSARYPGMGVATLDQVQARLGDELAVIARLGYATYFLTVALVCDLIRGLGVRVAARGSGAGSMVNYLLGISGVEPLAYGLLMERFCTPMRAQLPDIDIDVESARRTEIYRCILEHFGADRVTCVSMMDTYRVRHAVRDVGAGLGLLPNEIDAIAKAFPHIRASDAHAAIRDLPELRRSGLAAPRLKVLFDLVERLDGLPRHIALHPCGVILSDAGLLDRTPVEASWLGFPMSQFDKDDVEAIGLLKLDVLGIRMQSAMAHAVAEIARAQGERIDLDDRGQVRLDDEPTFELIRSTRTLGCFQIESPGQRELIGKFAPATFEDLIIDISLFRPGPVKSDMVTPFLRARQGWAEPDLLHPTLASALADTCGVVVFHEQVLRIVSITTGVSLAEADEVRRALGSPDGQEQVEAWWRPLARGRGYRPAQAERIWQVLKAFASFGFCKAHAAAFALPTYQSAWLKAHYPAAFLAGVLTHDPGMYPKRLILDDARNFGIPILGLDVNRSGETYLLEPVLDVPEGRSTGKRPAGTHLGERSAGTAPAGKDSAGSRSTRLGIRIALAGVKGISEREVQTVLAAQPFAGLDDFWHRAQASRPVTERLVLAGGFDSLYGIDAASPEGLGRRGQVTRRDLLLHLEDLDRWSRSMAAGRSRSNRPKPAPSASPRGGVGPVGIDVRAQAAAQSHAPAPVVSALERHVQLTLDLNDAPRLTPGAGLPEMSRTERVHAELDILGLDASEHVLTAYSALLEALAVVRAVDIRSIRSRSEVFVAGVKVATQTPPVRSGRRVVFLTLDDSTGPVDATFFEDVQGPYAATVFHSWLLLVRGVLRRTGPRGVSVRATGAWELSGLWELWLTGGIPAVQQALRVADEPLTATAESVQSVRQPAQQAGRQPTGELTASTPVSSRQEIDRGTRAGGMGGGVRRVLVHPSGFRQSPYADVRPPGQDVKSTRGLAEMVGSGPGSTAGRGRPGTSTSGTDTPATQPVEASDQAPAEPNSPVIRPPRKLWHASPGSAGQ